MDLELRKKLVKCYMWSVVSYSAETGKVWGVDQKNQKVLKCGAEEG
jgi:hypothetical protein